MLIKSLQEKYAPANACFGCGPSNLKGLRIKSFPKGDKFVCEFTPQPHHEAFPGIVNGGIIGTLLDCHSNWTAAWTLMQAQKLSRPPCTVTAEYHIKMLHPTPSDKKLLLEAKPVEVKERKVTVEASLVADGKICATCRGIFVAVKPGHAAYHRW